MRDEHSSKARGVKHQKRPLVASRKIWCLSERFRGFYNVNGRFEA